MANQSHGLTKGGRRPPTEYNIWATMKQRCHNRKNQRYNYYGARGIKVCLRWRRSFLAFLEDMGPRPDGMSLDRIDNDAGYSKENCRWADKLTQMRNRRICAKSGAGYPDRPLAEYAAELGLTHQALSLRIRNGWSIKDAISHPKGVSRNALRKMITLTDA